MSSPGIASLETTPSPTKHGDKGSSEKKLKGRKLDLDDIEEEEKEQ